MDSLRDYLIESKAIKESEFTPESLFILGKLAHKRRTVNKEFKDYLKRIQNLKESGSLSKAMEIFLYMLILMNANNIEILFDACQQSCIYKNLFVLFTDEQKNLYFDIDSNLAIEEISEPHRSLPMKKLDFKLKNDVKLNPENILPNKNLETPENTCEICFGTITPNEDYPFESCVDKFHVECINQYIKDQIDKKIIQIKCPVCSIEFYEADIMYRIDNEYKKKYFYISLQTFVKSDPEHFICCPTSGCNYIFDPKDIHFFNCPMCKNFFCLKCQVKYHYDYTCEDYQRYAANKSYEDQEFYKEAIRKNFKECPGCKFWVEKNTGSNHMICRCGTNFCYLCGARNMVCKCRKSLE